MCARSPPKSWKRLEMEGGKCLFVVKLQEIYLYMNVYVCACACVSVRTVHSHRQQKASVRLYISPFFICTVYVCISSCPLFFLFFVKFINVFPLYLSCLRFGKKICICLLIVVFLYRRRLGAVKHTTSLVCLKTEIRVRSDSLAPVLNVGSFLYTSVKA